MVEKYEQIICNHNRDYNKSVLVNNSEENFRMTVSLDTCAHSAIKNWTVFHLRRWQLSTLYYVVKLSI